MNPPNPSAGAPVTNKLILLVLSGIFVCLVLLVIRAFDRHPSVAPDVAVSVTSGPDAEAAPEAVSLIAPRPSAHRPTASTTRTPVISVITQPGTSEATEEPPATVSQTIFLSPPYSLHSLAKYSSGLSNSLVAAIAQNPLIVGTITLLGTPKPEIAINFGPSCGKFAPPATTRHYVVGPDGGLANVFVYVEDAKTAPVTGPGPLLDQVGCMYEPYVLGVGVNQKFGIRNSDPELHNVHASTKLNKEFNFAQMAGGAVMLRSFDKPEVLIRMKCDLHPWMFAYIGVVDHPWFSVSDTNGVFQITSGLPDGRYRLSAVHPKAGVQTQETVVKNGDITLVKFQLFVPSTTTPQTTQTRR